MAVLFRYMSQGMAAAEDDTTCFLLAENQRRTPPSVTAGCCLEPKAYLCFNLVLSMADVLFDSHPGSLAFSLQPVGAGYNLFEERPKLAEWRRRVEEAVGKQLFQEAHEGILNTKNLTADKIAPELLEHFKHQLLKQASQN